MAMARRVADVEPFQAKILQSDYVAKWDGKAAPSSSSGIRRLKEAVRRVLPASVLNHVLGLNHRRKASLSHRKHYRRVW
jgi:hypothetical protein